jgi:hypothetical protein
MGRQGPSVVAPPIPHPLAEQSDPAAPRAGKQGHELMSSQAPTVVDDAGREVGEEHVAWICDLPDLLLPSSESAADAVANVRRKRGVDHLDRL